MAINVVLFQPEIPPNTGNIARTCAITGAKLHLIKPLGFDIDEKSVKRAGLDYWHLLDLEVHESLEDFLEKYGDKEIYLSTTKASKYYDEASYSEDCFIVFGRETSGLPAMMHERYEHNRIKIPMRQNEAARSLNLSNSAAVIIYEVLRQLDFPTLK